VAASGGISNRSLVRLTKERKLYLAVLGLGLVALSADRLFFAPAGAQAAPGSSELPPESPSTRTAAKPSKPAAAAPENTEPALAERLRTVSFWDPAKMRDAFEAPVEWVGPRVAPKVEPPAEDSEFAKNRKHWLSTVMILPAREATPTTPASPATPVAIIGGGRYRVGDTLDNYKLVEIHADAEQPWVVFEGEGRRVKLTLDHPTDKGKSRRGG